MNDLRYDGTRADDTLRKLVTLKQGTLVKIRDLLNTGNDEQLRSILNFYSDILNKIHYIENKTYRNENFPEIKMNFACVPEDAYSDYAKFVVTPSRRAAALAEELLVPETPSEEEARFLSRPINTSLADEILTDAKSKIPYQELVRPPLKYRVKPTEEIIPDRRGCVEDLENMKSLQLGTTAYHMKYDERDSERHKFLLNPSSLPKEELKALTSPDEGLIFRSNTLQNQYEYNSKVNGEADLLVSPEEELFANYSI